MQPPNGPFRLPAIRALAGSLLLHAVVAFALWRLPGTRDSIEFPEHFVPIELSTVPAPTDTPAEDAAEPEPLPQTDAPDAETDAADQTDAASSTADAADAADQELLDPAPETQPAQTEPTEASVAEETQPATLPRPDRTEIDIAQAEAVASIVAALQAESEYHTFSLDDLPGGGAVEDLDLDGDGSDLDVFERAAQLKSDGVMPVGRSQSRFANTVADLCNQLTGGFSVFGIVDVCADPGPRADLFGHLRPEYMESLPMCTEDETLALQVEESEAGAVGSLKCVLVPREVREAYYRRYDPELAWWLPAESDE